MTWIARNLKYEDPEILAPDEDWGRRRSNMRHEVAVPGVITDRLGIAVRCDIEDISSTGMALGIEVIAAKPGEEPLKQGTIATLAFAPDPHNAPADRIEVPVRIMWRAPVAVGVRFEKPDAELRAALRTIAEAAVSERLGDGASARHELTAQQRAVLQACRRTVQKQLPNILWVLRTELVKRLRTFAAEASPGEARAANADADVVEAKAMGIARTIEHQFLQGFGEASDLEQTQELTMMQLKSAQQDRAAAIGVMQDQASEHNARITALAHAVEERYKSKFFELNVRLANVLGRPLDNEANPLVPGNACRILWHGVIAYADSTRVEKQLQQTMMKNVMPLIGELYEAINATLDEQGAQRILDVRQKGERRRD